MLQYKALFLKEFGGFFRNISIYVIWAIYCAVSVGYAIFFGSYLEMTDNSLYTMFYAQPLIWAVLLPALTMRSWSEEFKSGTAEFLLTQPVELYKIVLIKFFAVVCLCSIMSAGLLPFVIYSANLISIDWGNIILSFIGIWAVILLFTAIGGLISALCRNVMLAYVLTVFIIGCWIAAPFIYFYSVLQNFLFAEIGVPDILYFIFFTGGFLLLQVLAVEYQRLVVKNKTVKLLAFAVALIFGITCLWLFTYNVFTAKADFTARKIYSLKPQTREIVQNINEPIYIDVIVSKDYLKQNRQISHYFQQVKRFLQKYQKYSKGMIKVNSEIVEAFAAGEENAAEKGMFFEFNPQGSRNIFGAIVRNDNEQERIIKQLLPERKRFLEKDFDKALLQISNSGLRKNIGIFLDQTQNIDVYEGVLQNLENDYKLLNINGTAYEISAKLDLLILFNPKNLSANLLYAVDQYIMRGGKVLFLLDAYTESQSDEINAQSLEADQFFGPWGISIAGDTLLNSGKLSGNIYPYKQQIVFNNAMSFTVSDKILNITPFIEGENGFIGLILNGKIDSLFMFNPFFGYNNFALKMQPHINSNNQATVALIGDADWIEDKYWIDNRSADRNPFSVIERTPNMQVFRTLVDFLVGNNIYNQLPINGDSGEQANISEKIQKKSLLKYQDELISLNEDLQESYRIIKQQSGDNVDKFQEMLQVSSAGRQVAEQEEKLQNLLYQIQQDYAFIVRKIILAFVVGWPLCLAGILWILMRAKQKYNNRKIKEIFDE